MMSVKGGTQTWSTAQQQSGLKSDGNQTMSATDRDGRFQGEALGDTLNKVADPNYVDTSKKMQTHGNPQLGKDSFMTLLLTQMKNQDPTNPLKSHEMAAQLAQFTQLEKLTNIDQGIAGLHKEQGAQGNMQALAFIGKTITTDNSRIDRTSPTEQHEVRFNLPADAPEVKIQIKDATGNPVRALDAKGLKAGRNEVAWNGMLDDGSMAAPGGYTAAIEATGSNGRKIFVETKMEGTITGVNFTPQGPQLMVGKQAVNMADVKSISDPGVMQPNMSTPRLPNMQPLGAPASGPSPAAPAPAGPQSRNSPVKPESHPNAAKAAKLSQGNLNDAAMAQGLINSLNKEGAKAGMGS